MPTVIRTIDQLPTSGLTIRALEMLDTIVPGQWTNTTSFEDIIREVSGETKLGVNNAIRERAIALESGSQRYAQAIRVYELVDTVDQVAAGAALASKVGGLFGGLGFLERFTPRPATTQAIDAGVKLVAEAIAFGLLHGKPTKGSEGLARFAVGLEDYVRFDLVRIAAWVVFDGLLPLGPDFLGRMTNTFRRATSDDLGSNKVFQALASQVPGKGTKDKQAFIVEAIDTTGGWITGFVREKGITQDKVAGHLKGVLGVAAGGMEYVAAALDASTTYYSHTGKQTVGRALARQAQEMLKEEIWREWVDARP